MSGERKVERSLVHYDVGEAIPAELEAAARAVVERSACNNVGCEEQCRCVVAPPSPGDPQRWAIPDEEREAEYQRWLEREEYRQDRGYYDDVSEREASDGND
jgi:hypothetical protein